MSSKISDWILYFLNKAHNSADTLTVQAYTFFKNMSGGTLQRTFRCVCCRGRGWRRGWGEGGGVRVQQGKAVRKTHKLIHQRFKSISKQRWKKSLYQRAQGSSFGEEQVYRSREGRNDQSQRKGRKKSPLDSNLQIKKQSNQSCRRALIPGCSFQAAAE